MAKEVAGYLKLQIKGGQANPAPPVGPALGQRGINIMDFCKAFNDKTKDVEKGAPIPVIITAYKDRSFDFITKLPPVSYYLKKAAKIKKGNSTPGRTMLGKVTMADIEKIVEMAGEILEPTNYLALEFGDSQSKEIAQLLKDNFECKFFNDQYSVKRFVLACKK